MEGEESRQRSPNVVTQGHVAGWAANREIAYPQ